MIELIDEIRFTTECIKRYCPKCSNELEVEKEKEIDYPFVCWECDENFYEFETIKTK